MKISATAIALAGLLATLPAAADWQYTKWGMSIDQAARASGNALRLPNSQEQSKRVVNGLPPGLVGTYDNGSFRFTVDLYFGGAGKSLSSALTHSVDLHKFGMCDAGPMAQTICVIISTADRERLQAIVEDRNRPQKHVERARIVLASADRGPAQRVAQRLGVSRPTVWRWQQRFAEAGVDGLLRDKTRKPGKAPIPAETTARVVGLTCTHATSGDPLDRPCHGQGDRPFAALGAAHLAVAPATAAPHPHFQAFARSGLCRQTH